MYSCLAGFVEAAESLEEAVLREVAEESGVVVDIDSLQYHSSQVRQDFVLKRARSLVLKRAHRTFK